jgi:hypothetical protein
MAIFNLNSVRIVGMHCLALAGEFEQKVIFGATDGLGGGWAQWSGWI